MKGKYNEAAAFARQDASMDSSISNLTQQASDYEADKDNFDRAAFDQLKRDLSERKKLKEDMLTGTIARFKPYLRL